MAYNIPLITNQDGFEDVRNAIGNILEAEQLNQQAQAVTEELNPDDFALNVFVERSNPWEFFRDNVPTTQIPIVNIWYDGGNTSLNASNLRTKQQASGRFYIDCIGYGLTKETETGQESGDQLAALEAQRAARIVRQILMHDKYVQLGVPSVAKRRYFSDRQAFQPVSGDNPVQNVAGIRLTLTVDHFEFVYFDDYETYEQAFITMRFEPGGKIIAQMDIDPVGE